jgi:hypothetical protein
MRAHMKKRYMFIQCRVIGMTSKKIPIIMPDSSLTSLYLKWWVQSHKGTKAAMKKGSCCNLC